MGQQALLFSPSRAAYPGRVSDLPFEVDHRRVDELAARLGKKVLFVDLASRPIVGNGNVNVGDRAYDLGHGNAPELLAELERASADAKRSAFWLPAFPQWHMAARLCVPIRHGNRTFGHLWVVDSKQTLTGAEIALTKKFADRIAFEFDARDRGRLNEEHVLQRELRLLLSDRGDESAIAGRLVSEWRLPAESRFLVMAVDLPHDVRHDDFVAASAQALKVKNHLAGAVPEIEWLVQISRPVILLGRALRPSKLDFLERARSSAETLTRLSGTPVAVGVAGPAVALREVRAARASAVTALKVASGIDGAGGVRSWPELGSWRWLVEFVDAHRADHDSHEWLPAGLNRLLEEERKDLLWTAEVYCTCGGDERATAAKLHLHQSVLRHRLGLIAESTGLDPYSGEDRFELLLSLRIARMAGLLSE